jgi:hypothetical protein
MRELREPEAVIAIVDDDCSEQAMYWTKARWNLLCTPTVNPFGHHWEIAGNSEDIDPWIQFNMPDLSHNRPLGGTGKFFTAL